MQFIHPKLQKRQSHPPRTTRLASRPPSGKSAGLMPPAVGVGGGSSPRFSRSASASIEGSGRMFASVCLSALPWLETGSVVVVVS